MKHKKQALWAGLLALKALANPFLVLVVAIVGLSIGGYVVWRVLDCLRRWFPQPTPEQVAGGETNNVTTILYLSNFASSAQSPLEVVETTNNTFTVQYGIYVFNRLPWVSSGSNYANTPYGAECVVQDDGTNYEVTVSRDGWTFHNYSRVDIESAEFDWREMIAPATITIERTTDFADWVPVFTDTRCGVNTVSTFVDTNAPPVQAYYRTMVTQ
jgi:hypothetical protein